MPAIAAVGDQLHIQLEVVLNYHVRRPACWHFGRYLPRTDVLKPQACAMCAGESGSTGKTRRQSSEAFAHMNECGQIRRHVCEKYLAGVAASPPASESLDEPVETLDDNARAEGGLVLSS